VRTQARTRGEGNRGVRRRISDKLSYEFMVLTDAGEDDVVYCEHCTHCANVEVAKEKEGDTCPKCGAGTLRRAAHQK